jgi:uncharacterized repeat protein (TIGR03803 family)
MKLTVPRLFARFSARVSNCLLIFTLFGGLLGTHLAGAQTLSSLMFFNGSRAVGGVTFGIDGKLYGIGSESTFGTGATAGLIYSLATDASQVTTIYQYGRLGVYTGGGPRGTLARDASGNLYGVTAYDRLDAITAIPSGTGTVFRISQDISTYTQLHVFSDSLDTAAPFTNTDGITPLASLLLANDGFLYGTTTQGGTTGGGTVFKVGTDGGGFAVLHNFQYSTTVNGDSHPINSDGFQPATRLMLGADGDLYGTTIFGGVNGTGVIYKLHRDGTGFTVLFSFDVSSPQDATTGLQINSTGAYPSSGLLQISNGSLYGTAGQQGANGYGNIYRISTDGSGFTVLQSFAIGTIGANPSGELILARDGTIVGTTGTGALLADGVTAGSGTLYSLSADGLTLTTLYVFGTDGAGPGTGVIQGSDGSFYGTTSGGGPYGLGTVFKFGTSTSNAAQGTPQPAKSYGAMDESTVAALLTILATAVFARRKRRAN